MDKLAIYITKNMPAMYDHAGLFTCLLKSTLQPGSSSLVPEF